MIVKENEPTIHTERTERKTKQMNNKLDQLLDFSLWVATVVVSTNILLAIAYVVKEATK